MQTHSIDNSRTSSGNSADTLDDAVTQKSQTNVEEHVKKGEDRLSKLRLSKKSSRICWHFQLL